MPPRIKIGSRVSTEAWQCDNEKLARKPVVKENWWSFSVFGEKWRDSRVIGTVIDRKGEKWVVRFDIDNGELPFDTDNLELLSDDEPPQLLPLLLPLEDEGMFIFSVITRFAEALPVGTIYLIWQGPI